MPLKQSANGIKLIPSNLVSEVMGDFFKSKEVYKLVHQVPGQGRKCSRPKKFYVRKEGGKQDVIRKIRGLKHRDIDQSGSWSGTVWKNWRRKTWMGVKWRGGAGRATSGRKWWDDGQRCMSKCLTNSSIKKIKPWFVALSYFCDVISAWLIPCYQHAVTKCGVGKGCAVAHHYTRFPIRCIQ